MRITVCVWNGMVWYGIGVYERRAKPGVREKSKVDWIGEGRK